MEGGLKPILEDRNFNNSVEPYAHTFAYIAKENYPGKLCHFRSGKILTIIHLAFIKSQIDSSECAGVLGSKSKYKFNDPVDAFRHINVARQKNNVPSEDSNKSGSRLSLSDRFKDLTSNSIPSNSSNGQIVSNEQAMPNRPISRARRTGGSEQNNTPKINSLPETARPMQTSVDKVLEQPVAKTPTRTVPKYPFPSFLEDVSSDDELPPPEEIVQNVAKKSLTRTQNGK